MSKVKKVWLLALIVFVSIGVLVWRLFFYDNRPYLQGDVIRLIDHLNDKEVWRRSPKISLKTIRKEPLRQGWQKVTELESGICIWQTYSSQFSVRLSPQDSDPEEKVFRKGHVLRYRNDLSLQDTPADCWRSEDDRVFISTAKGDDPNPHEYFMDYRSFKKIGLEMVKKEALDNPILYAVIPTDQGNRRLAAYPLRQPLWARMEKGTPVEITVRKDGQTLLFRQDLAQGVSPRAETIRPIYPTPSSSPLTPFLLAKTSDQLTRVVYAAPGTYFIRIVARASPAGLEPPRAIIRIGGQEVARLSITSEDWRSYSIKAVVKKRKTRFSLEYVNDDFDSAAQKHGDIFVSKIDLRATEGSAFQQAKAENDDRSSCTWTWLDDSENVLYQAAPFDMFKMFSQRDVYSVRRFLQPGLVSFRITAKADLAGQEYPRLGVYLDKKRVGTIQISDTVFREYRSENIPVGGGWGDIKIVFENDFVDPRTGQDRNIYLTEIVMTYASAVLIDEPINQPRARYIISYPSKASYLAELQLYRDSIYPIVDRLDLMGDVRNALVFPPRAKLTYRIQVPVEGMLRFGYGASFANERKFEKENTACPVRLIISAKEAWHPPKTIISAEVSPSDTGLAQHWQEEVIKLPEIAGKKVEFFIEAQPAGLESSCAPVLFVSNPAMTSGSGLPQKEPNIIIIAADALRADHLSCYGYGRKTAPNIDQFAGDSVLFEDAVSQAPWTLPSFSSLFTSLYPSFHGASFIDSRLLSSETRLPNILKKNGYLTAANVNNFFLYPSQGLSEGFDFYRYRDSDIQKQLQAISRQLEAIKEQKFFFFIHLLLPHEPYLPPHPYDDAFGKADKALIKITSSTLMNLEKVGKHLSGAERNYLMSQYDGAILYLDGVLKQLFDRIKQLGLYQNSLIIFLSDHGEQFQEHGHLSHMKSLYQEELHVPLIMKLPSGYGLAAGRFPGTVRSIDVPATILDIINIRPPNSFQGQTLVPFLRGKPLEDGFAFAELNSAGILAIRKGRYKYIYTALRNNPLPSKKNSNLSEKGGEGKEELYDLKEDPAETHNLSTSRPDLLEMFRQERKTFTESAARYRQTRYGTQEADRIVLDVSLRERLRSLGYIR